MRRSILPVLAGLLACSRTPIPEVSPMPALPAVSDSQMSEVVLAGSANSSDYTSTTAVDLDRRTADLFRDALRVDATIPMPADSGLAGMSTESAPSWDIDVRTYEAFGRVRH